MTCAASSVEHDYAIVRSMLLEFEAEDWDVDAARHALQRLWYVLLKNELGSKDALAEAIRSQEAACTH